MAVRLQFDPRREPPDLLDLPWGTPLAEWRHPRLVRMAKGRSRHVVRFVSDGDRVYALKETTQHEAEREYAMLRLLAEENLPVVEAVGLVTGRQTPDGTDQGRSSRSGGCLRGMNWSRTATRTTIGWPILDPCSSRGTRAACRPPTRPSPAGTTPCPCPSGTW